MGKVGDTLQAFGAPLLVIEMTVHAAVACTTRRLTRPKLHSIVLHAVGFTANRAKMWCRSTPEAVSRLRVNTRMQTRDASSLRPLTIACLDWLARSSERQRYPHSYRSFPSNMRNAVCACKDSAVNLRCITLCEGPDGPRGAAWGVRYQARGLAAAVFSCCVATSMQCRNDAVAKCTSCATLWFGRSDDSAVTM